MREAELDGGTLTEIEGKKLLQQLQEMATNKQALSDCLLYQYKTNILPEQKM